MSSEIQARLSSAIGETYAIERELGTGGMAVVFLARDRKHDREVAIKVLLPDLSAIIGAERFEREIRVAGKLQHPHILGMFDSGVADGLLYYVMPFVRGESLRDKLDREGQLPLDDALQIILEVADALGYAHEQGIIHRDIKPENILLQGGHALLADFGIAHAVEDGGQKLTQTGMSLGTAAYMAPEQGMGEKIGPAADVYALGCVLYEMLAGEPPFSGKNAAAILAKHVMEQVPSVRIVRPSVPEEIELAIFAAMGKSPADRPQSCAAWAELLVAVPSGHTSTRLMTMRHTTARRTGMMTSAFGVATPAPAPLWKRPMVLAPSLLVLLAAAFGAWKLLGGAKGPALSTTGGLDPKRIAVLYFETGGVDSLATIADGLTDGVIDALSSVQDLSVVSRGGVEAWRGATATVTSDSIARALQAGTIVLGRVEARGDKVDVTVRLQDGNSGTDFGSARRLEFAATDVARLRDSTAQEVAAIVRERLGTEVRLREQRTGTGNTDAWLLVQRSERLRRGANARASRDSAAAALAEADTLLAAAAQLDPRWPTPVIGRAEVAYEQSRLGGLDPVAARDPIERGIGFADRALELAPSDPEALEVRGNLQYWKYLLHIEPDTAKANALRDAARADYEKSGTAGAYASLSHLLYNLPDATLSQVNIAAQRAYEKDAFLANAETVLGRLVLSSYDLNQPTDVQRWCAEMQRRFPASFQAPRCQLFQMTLRGGAPDIARAWRLADSTVALVAPERREFQRRNSDLLVAAVIARAWQADSTSRMLADSARAIVSRSRGSRDIDPTADLAQFAAFVEVLLGDAPAAIRDLSDFVAASPKNRQALASEPPPWWFAPIAQTPEYRRLVGSAP